MAIQSLLVYLARGHTHRLLTLSAVRGGAFKAISTPKSDDTELKKLTFPNSL